MTNHKTNTPRLRFAPAPTGTMHLGNIRAALMNYLFAKQNNGTFVLRIEDTDTERNFDPNATHIIEHLQWIGLDYDEGPVKGGPYAPYFQSQRNNLYEQACKKLIDKKAVYRCFCSTEELDKKRERQIALKIPPRYDRTCLTLQESDIARYIADNVPYIWRFKLNHDQNVTIHDLARGNITFELKNFSDFPITRSNGSFTFIFANFFDDMIMGMTHVFRGEDHLTNTANQAALYAAFDAALPAYYHLPILCNNIGQKLSKRDFGFSIVDLQTGGYLPEAICNYLAILGGGSFSQEVIPFDELHTHVRFDNLHATGQVKYDEVKLRWFNHQWINRYLNETIAALALPFVQEQFPSAAQMEKAQFIALIGYVKKEMQTLADAPKLLSFFFEAPNISAAELTSCLAQETIALIRPALHMILQTSENSTQCIQQLKSLAKDNQIGVPALFSFIRLALTGSVKGLGIGELIDCLGMSETQKRLEQALR